MVNGLTYVSGVLGRGLVALGASLAAVLAIASPAWALDAQNDHQDVASPTFTRVYGRVTVAQGDAPVQGHFEFGLASSSFCTTNGADSTGMLPTLDQPITSTRVIVAELDLPAGNAYCWRVRATNNAAVSTAPSSVMRFTSGSPEAITDFPHSTSASSVSVPATVDPNGQAVTARVRWGFATEAFCTSGGSTGPGRLSADVISIPSANYGNPPATPPVPTTTFTLSDPQIAGQAICVEVVATNVADGLTSDLQGARSVLAGAPEPSITTVFGTGPASAELRGRVTTFGQPATLHFEYAEQASTFCTNHAGTGTPTAPQGIGGTAGQFNIRAQATGLDPAKSYCYALIADAGGAIGTVSSAISSPEFRAGSPALALPTVAATAATSVTLSDLASTGQPGWAAKFEYAVLGSSFCQTHGLDGNGVVSFPETAIAPDGAAHAYQSTLPNLLPSTTYCARPIARTIDDTLTPSFAVGPETASSTSFITFTTSAQLRAAGPGVDINSLPVELAASTEPDPSPVIVTKLPAFSQLSVARTTTDPSFSRISFSVAIGKAKSKIHARLLWHTQIVGSTTLTGGPGRVKTSVALTKRGRKLLRRKQSATFSLEVTVTPPGAKAITKRAVVTLRRRR